MRRIFTCLLGGALSALSVSAQENLVPLKVTNGFNADVVVEAMPAEEHLTLGIDNAKTGFFTNGLYVANERGLALEMPLKSKNEHVYNIDYAANNALVLRTAEGKQGTLTLATPIQTTELWLLGISADGNSTLSITVNYTDGSSDAAQSLTYKDWWNSNTSYSYEAFSKLDRINPSNGTPQGVDKVHLDEYKVTCDATKSVKSVDIKQTSTTGSPSILALSTGTSAVTIASGLTEDIIAEKTPVSEAVTTGIDGEGWVLMTKAVGSKTYDEGGLPVNGVVTTGSGTTYNIDYTNLNAARLGTDSRELTLTIGNAPQCEKLYFLGTTGNGPQTISAVINYADGTKHDKQTFSLADWYQQYDGGDGVIKKLARIDNGGMDARYHFCIYERSIDANKEKAIESVTLTATGGTPIIMAVAGQGGNVTSINNIEVQNSQNLPAYNLQGQRIGNGFKGICIKGGRKYVIR